jgi:hypothetical protein
LRGRRACHGVFVDKRSLILKTPGRMRKRIALKYCGGCNAGFDRVEYFKQIQDAAGDLIEWVTLDDRDLETVLVICGCDTSCPVENMVQPARLRIVSIRDNERDPAEIVHSLLSEASR